MKTTTFRATVSACQNCHLKTAISVSLILLSALGATAQQDLRTISGISVDLAPVHEWCAKKGSNAERPLKHWQRLWILDYKKSVGSWDLCIVRMEDGAEVDLFVAHLPAKIRTAFASRNAARAERDALEEQILAEESTLATLPPPRSLYARRQAAALRDDLVAKKYRLKFLYIQVGRGESVTTGSSPGEPSSEYSTGRLNVECLRATKAPLFAMRVGKYANYPLWDTGLPFSGLE